MLVTLGSLIIGLIAGFLGQRSRMCFIGGFRDLLLIRDKDLLKGAISFFASAWLTVIILTFISNNFTALSEFTNVRLTTYPAIQEAFLSKFGLISILGGLGLGFFSTLSGGCPLRQHVMAGQGRVDSIIYLAGFYIGILIYYFLTVRFLARLF